MYSVRKWMFRPKKTDTSLLAQFYFADEELNAVAAELDKFDGRKDPERCSRWVNRLRACQDRVLSVIENIMDDALGEYCRTSRDFRVKFPDDVLQESLSGQLWFGAECLAAGSSILNREAESASIRPLAKAVTRQLDYVRSTLREQCLRNLNFYSDEIRDALVIFDRLFAEFELSYVSAMVPVKTMKEYDTLQEVIVLFSDTVQRALELKLLTQDMLEDCDPALMFAIPRLAIICGLLVYPEGPLNPDMDPLDMSEMFRPFQTLLYNIRELMRTLDKRELMKLETILCRNNSPSTPDVIGGHFNFMDVTTSDSSSGGQDASTSTVDPLIAPASPAGLQLCDQSQYCAYLHVNSSDSDSADGMSRSVSIDTVIVNAATNDKYLAPSGESRDRTRGSTSSSMHHQDSVDSGLLSGSDGAVPVTTSWQHSNVVMARCLRHSLSWPEISKQRAHRHMHEPNTRGRTLILEGLNLGSGSTFDASMFSPLGGSAGVMETANYHLTNIDQVAIPSDVTTSDSVVCVTANNIDSDDGLQVSYVTPTLSDVFLTDTFQSTHGAHSSDESSSSDTRVDVPMETTSGALATASGDICDTTSNYDNDVATNIDSERMRSTLQVPSTSGRDMSESGCAVNLSSPSSASKQRDSKKTHKSKRTDDHVTSHDCGRCTERQKCDPRTWEQDSIASSDTSSYTSACHDDEEIAMAIQAAELAARQEARSRFKNTSDLLHRLFVCISGVADQLQTNYAGDLRNVLKAVFEINCPQHIDDDDNDSNQDGRDSPTTGSGDNSSGEMNTEEMGSESGADTRTFGVAPPWVPDEQTTHCTGCQVAFSFVRRKHHCRNCGKIFCGRCSSNSTPLPHFRFEKAVRVCNHCFMFELTPFTTDTYE